MTETLGLCKKGALVRCAFLKLYYKQELLECAAAVAKQMLKVIDERFPQNAQEKCFPTLPEGVPKHYSYRSGKRQTQRDPMTQPADVAEETSADVKARSIHDYNKTNMLYTAASVERMKAAFARSRALSLTIDELSFLDTSVLQVFAASPATPDVAYGCCCPPQLLPEMNIDLQTKSLGVRIAEQLPAGPAARAVGKPAGDDLICSWHVCQGLQNAVKNLLPEQGLAVFRSQATAVLAGPGRYARGRDGRWQRKRKGGKWEMVIHGTQSRT